MMIEVIVIFVICIIAALILKLFKHSYNSALKAEKNVASNLVKRKPPYGAYKKVSKKASPPNSPKRTSGDFFDYIQDRITTDQDAIENNILRIYGENIDE